MTKIVFEVGQSQITGIFNYIVLFISAVLSSIIGLYMGNRISKGKERRDFSRDMHIKYLEVLNLLIYKINQLIMDIDNINKFGKFLLKNEFAQFDFKITDDYSVIITKLHKLEEELLTDKYGNDKNPIKNKRYDDLIQYFERPLNVNYFLEIMHDYQRDVVNIQFFVEDKFRKKYLDILNEIAEATKNDMKGFDVQSFKHSLIFHVGHVIKYINDNFLKKTRKKMAQKQW